MITMLLVTLLASPQATVEKPLEETKKNIVALKGVPTSQLIPIMTVMANSLGVACSYCHEEAWDSDAKPAKEAGRRMIRLTRAINDTHYGGRVAVTCNTCHHGSVATTDVPLVENAGWNKVKSAALQPQLPPAEELFTKYMSTAAAETVKSRRSRGIATARSGRADPRSAPFELLQERPDKAELKIELPYPPEGDREIRSQFFSQSRIRERYASVKTVGIDTVREHSVYVVEAVPKDGGLPERLSFDALTGLLLRRHREVPTLVGMLPEEYDFDDYRTIDGALVPFLVQWSRADYQVTHRIAEVTQTGTP